MADRQLLQFLEHEIGRLGFEFSQVKYQLLQQGCSNQPVKAVAGCVLFQLTQQRQALGLCSQKEVTSGGAMEGA